MNKRLSWTGHAKKKKEKAKTHNMDSEKHAGRG